MRGRIIPRRYCINMTELESLRQELDALKAEVTSLRQASAAADDYRQITNAMMGHVYSYYNHSERNDLKTFWVQSRDDIVYAHNNRGYFGKQGVWEYYIDGTDRTKKNYHKYAREIYNLEYPEGTAPGYRVIHVLGSPYIEIAGDRKTAQGIWMSFSFMSNMNAQGVANPSYVLQRFAGDFLNENGVWKLWHVRDYTDVSMEIETNTEGPEVARDDQGRPIERMGPPMGGKKGAPDMPPPGKDDKPPIQQEDGKKVRKLVLESSNMYNPWTVTRNEPAIPMPYETWDPKQCYITIVPEHQDEDSGFKVP